MAYKYSLSVGNPSIKKKMATPQFELSEKLLDKRYELDFTIEKLAQITKETIEDYLKMEYASSDIPIERYSEALKKISSFQLLSETRDMDSTAIKENSYSIEIEYSNLDSIEWKQSPINFIQVGEVNWQPKAS